jgi:hypothetical protein
MFAAMPAAGMDVELDEDEVEEKGAKTAGSDRIVNIHKLTLAVAKVSLMHEAERRAAVRDQHVVLDMPEDSLIHKGMMQSTAAYEKAGKEERQRAKDAAEDFKGHSMGKKPDAFLRFLMFRTSEALTTKEAQAKEKWRQSGTSGKGKALRTPRTSYGSWQGRLQRRR